MGGLVCLFLPIAASLGQEPSAPGPEQPIVAETADSSPAETSDAPAPDPPTPDENPATEAAGQANPEPAEPPVAASSGEATAPSGESDSGDPPPADTPPAEIPPADKPPTPNEPNRGGSPDTPAVSARLMRVPVPLRGEDDRRIKQAIDRLLEEWSPAQKRPCLILQFEPQPGTEGRGTEFERAFSLANYLTTDRLRRVRIVAYVPQTIRGHAVLPVLACEQIVMNPDAELGDASADEETIGPMTRQNYAFVADRRRTIPPAVALGMLDPDIKVLKVQTDQGIRYITADELPALEKETPVRSIDTLIPEGQVGLMTGRQLRAEGFVSHLVDDRRQLAETLRLGEDFQEVDAEPNRDWRPARIEIAGRIDHAVVGRLIRRIDREKRNGMNFLCVEITSSGGRAEEVLRLADYLAGLKTDRVRTVAFIPIEAGSNAALIAAGCDEIVLGENAVLGETGSGASSVEEIPDILDAVRLLAEKKSRDWSLWGAMIDPDLSVDRWRHQTTGMIRYFCRQELDEQQDPDQWRREREVTEPGKAFSATGREAIEYGLADYTADDLATVSRIFGLESLPEAAQPSWADQFATALATPAVAGILLFIAGFALIAELSSPGIGVAGFVSLLCFVLYFWSQFLNGTAEWLEVMLFCTGLVCLLLEVFVIPGFGIFGIGGAIMIVVSLILAAQTFFIPRSVAETEQFAGSLVMVLAAGGGMLVGMVVLRRYFDRLPFLNRIALMPPRAEKLLVQQEKEALVDRTYLLGRRGVTATRLTPSGKARFDDELVDVIADGLLVAKGTPIEVVQVLGSRVIVEPIEE